MNPIGMVFQHRRRSSNNSSRVTALKDGPEAMCSLRRTPPARPIVPLDRLMPPRLRRTMDRNPMADTAMFPVDLIPRDSSNRMDIQMDIRLDHRLRANRQREQPEEQLHLEPALWASACPQEVSKTRPPCSCFSHHLFIIPFLNALY